MSTAASPLPSRRMARVRRTRRRAGITGVLGELCLSAGALILLFLGWQLWFTEITVGGQLRAEARELSKEWNLRAPAVTPVVPESSEKDPPIAQSGVESVIQAPVALAPADTLNFGMLIVPRFGDDYYRTIAEGVGAQEVLDVGKLGHYPSTQMPGEAGNFALAAHRMGRGGSLHHIHELQLGDHIFVETADGWYQYSFRNLEYVHPSGVGVLDPVPQTPANYPEEHYITLTSCNPQYTTAERIIAYGVYDRFFPRDVALSAYGAPEEIAYTVTGETV